MSLQEKHELLRMIGTGMFAIVDHWEGDRLAIGLANPRDPRVLAYVAVDPENPQHFFVELELPSQGITDIPYTAAGAFEQLTLSAMTDIVARHLGIDVNVKG